MIQDPVTGLILPEHVTQESAKVQLTDKGEETWTYDTIRKLRYAAKDLNERDVDMIIACRQCRQPLRLEVEGNVEQLVCGCKVRKVRR